MIIRFGIFEKVNQGKPEVGDYVLGDISELPRNNALRSYLRSHIGRISRLTAPSDTDNSIEARYDPPFSDSEKKFFDSRNERWVEIVYWSKDKKDLEKLLKYQKFGL